MLSIKLEVAQGNLCDHKEDQERTMSNRKPQQAGMNVVRLQRKALAVFQLVASALDS